MHCLSQLVMQTPYPPFRMMSLMQPAVGNFDVSPDRVSGVTMSYGSGYQMGVYTKYHVNIFMIIFEAPWKPLPQMLCFFMHCLSQLVMRTPYPPFPHDVVNGCPQCCPPDPPLFIEHGVHSRWYNIHRPKETLRAPYDVGTD